MGRLIDADDFKKFLQALCKAGAPYEEVVQLLDNQPTAYDVEKVVAELEEEGKCYARYSVNTDGVKSIPTYKAIDIVKRGGVEW